MSLTSLVEDLEIRGREDPCDAIGPSQDLTTRRQNAKKNLAHAINRQDSVREFVESDLSNKERPT